MLTCWLLGFVAVTVKLYSNVDYNKPEASKFNFSYLSSIIHLFYCINYYENRRLCDASKTTEYCSKTSCFNHLYLTTYISIAKKYHQHEQNKKSHNTLMPLGHSAQPNPTTLLRRIFSIFIQLEPLKKVDFHFWSRI